MLIYSCIATDTVTENIYDRMSGDSNLERATTIADSNEK